MIGYIYFLQKEDSVDVFKIVTVLGDIRQISIIIKAKVTNPEEKKQIFHDLLFNENYVDVENINNTFIIYSFIHIYV